MSKISFALGSLLLLAAMIVAFRRQEAPAQPWYMSRLSEVEFHHAQQAVPIAHPSLPEQTEEPPAPVRIAPSAPAAPSEKSSALVSSPPPVEPKSPPAAEPQREPEPEPKPEPEIKREPEPRPAPPVVAATPPKKPAREIPPWEQAAQEPTPEPENPPTSAAPPARSPPAERVVETPRPEAVPRTPGAITPLPPVATEKDIVLHAAGAVEVRPPLNWHVYEAPHHREVRLVMSPKKITSRKKTIRDGMWITCHVTANDPALRRQEINSWSEDRLQKATRDRAQSQPPFERSIGGHPAVVREFTVPPRERAVANDDDDDDKEPDTSNEALRGVHCLVGPPWGVCEIFAVAPESLHADRQAEFENLLNQIAISSPDTALPDPIAEVADAAAIHGVWKASRSRLRFMPDGRVEMEGDPLVLTALGEPPPTDAKFMPEHLHGRYTADGDLLRVIWEDDSKLNFRWKLKDADLLLTDHQGQISQLKRIFQ